MEFRKLRADEIECRIGTVKKDGSGMSLLLYKDARCDMNILDETVGSFNWDREHKELKGVIYCGVTIRAEDGNYATKWDAGTESNTEAQKGEASDSFKRACFNWGIGRELYTAPFIYIKAADCNIGTGKAGKPTCYDKFSVKSVTIEDGAITSLSIMNNNTRKIVFTYGNGKASNTERIKSDAEENSDMMKKASETPIDNLKVEVLKRIIADKGLTQKSIYEHYGKKSLAEMTVTDYVDAVGILEKYKDKEKK